jgi:hypothetical protein
MFIEKENKLSSYDDRYDEFSIVNQSARKSDGVRNNARTFILYNSFT